MSRQFAAAQHKRLLYCQPKGRHLRSHDNDILINSELLPVFKKFRAPDPVPQTTNYTTNSLPIETARLLATVLLVSFHVIGSGPEAGLRVAYPHPARLFAEFFADLRMPLFAFIAGVVYALKPISPPRLGGFFTGKLRRLLLPGTVAIVLSAVVTTHFGLRLAPDGPIWHLAVLPYLHYWFLWSIFLIFVIYAPLDALTGGRALLPCLGIALAVNAAQLTITPNLFSINGAIRLFPYFLLGVLFLRSFDRVQRHRIPLLGLAATLVLAATLADAAAYAETGVLSNQGRGLQTMAFAIGGCLLAFLVLPNLPWLSWFGAMSFTIYLYHVFGTSAARRALHAAGIEDMTAHIVLGVAAGFAVPMALHMLARRSALTRTVVLGLRQPRAERRATPA